MLKLSKQLLNESGSYVEALQKAINGWNNPTATMKDKKDYILVIGEIGNAIHKQNKSFDIKNMDI